MEHCLILLDILVEAYPQMLFSNLVKIFLQNSIHCSSLHLFSDLKIRNPPEQTPFQNQHAKLPNTIVHYTICLTALPTQTVHVGRIHASSKYITVSFSYLVHQFLYSSQMVFLLCYFIISFH
jgi:hypothetical protein